MKLYTNTPLLSKTQIHLLARALERNIKDYFKDEENAKKFAEWKAKQHKN